VQPSDAALAPDEPRSALPRASVPPFVEFLLAGGATLALFPLSWLCRRRLGLDDAELTVSLLASQLAFVINDPHFASTYLLFYRDVRRRALGDVFAPVQRARYWLAGLVAPLALAAWAAWAIASRSGQALGGLIQLMFFLVGWHYTKQGFGVLAVLSARQGVALTPLERGAFLAHCLAGWAYSWASPVDLGRKVREKGVIYRTLPHGSTLELLALGAFVVSALALVFALVQGLRRRGRLPPLAPLFGCLCTVWLWTIHPALDPLVAFLIPALHSVQYLYFVWIMRHNQAREREGPPDFGRPAGVQVGLLALSSLALGWLLLHGLPGFLDGALVPRADRLTTSTAIQPGPTPYFAAISVIVNIHHYLMDSVLWRRENPETRHLRS